MKPNVLQLIGSFNEGGSELQALQLTKSLLESDRYNVHLACMSPAGPLLEHARELGFTDIPAYPLDSFYAPSTAAQLNRFVRFLRNSNIDLLHTHDFYTNVFGMAGATLARTRARVASKRETGGMRTRAQRRIELYGFKLAHRVVVNSDAVRQQLTRDGLSNKKIVTIHNGLDLSRFECRTTRSSALRALHLPTDKPLRLVTIVANLRHAVKDHPTFLRAAFRVKAAISDSAFVVAGEGELLDSMRALAGDLGLGNDVHFIGRCENVAALLAISDVCVLSSLAEGFSNAILEYMAASRPVVATDVGGAREVIDEGVTGFLVAPQDHVAMADRIIELLNDPQRAQAMGERGKSVVKEKFSREAQLGKTEQLYERLLSGEKTEVVTDGKLFPTRS